MAMRIEKMLSKADFEKLQEAARIVDEVETRASDEMKTGGDEAEDTFGFVFDHAGSVRSGLRDLFDALGELDD